MENPLDLLRDRYKFDLPDHRLQEIVNTCAEIIVIQDQQERDEGNQKAAVALGWLDDDDDPDDEWDECDGCGSGGNDIIGGFCHLCRMYEGY